MATTMGYRPTGLMICTNPKVTTKNSKNLRIDTNVLKTKKKPKAPPRPPRRSNSLCIWDRLPKNVIDRIAENLTSQDLINLGLSCRSSYRAVTLANPVLLVRRQYFTCIFKHLEAVAEKYDGRAAFVTDAIDVFDEMAEKLGQCYGGVTGHRNGSYSDYDCDFVFPMLPNDPMTRSMFISDMLSVYSHVTGGCFWEEERDGPPTAIEEEDIYSTRPKHGRWFNITPPAPSEKKSGVVARIRKKFRLPYNQIKRLPPMSPVLRKSSEIEFNEGDVKSIILRWAHDKVTGVYMMSFIKVYKSGWGFEWLLGSHLNKDKCKC